MASLQLSGYQCEFFESVVDYECPLCLHVTREPSLTSCCGQHFCQACIQKIAFDNKPCPLCKESSFTTLLDKKQRRRVLDLKVYCDKKAGGCDWVDGLGELEQHLGEKCELVFVNCPQNCGEAYARRFLAAHIIYDCPRRPHSCKYCHLMGKYQDIQDVHLPVCPEYPVECPNECGVAPLARGQLEGHLRECPLAMVECELKELGCEEVVQRKDVDKHMEQAAQKHLRIMASHYLKSQRRQDEVIAKLQEDNEKLHIELKESFEEKQRSSKMPAVTTQDKAMSRFRRGTVTQEFEPKSKELLALSSQIDILTRHVGVTSTSVTVNYTKKKVKHQSWTNTQQFRTVPTGYIMKINLFFNSGSLLEVELTPMMSSANDKLKWPKTFTVTANMLNQADDHDHHQITKDLEVKRDECNDEIQIDYDTIDNPPSGVQYIVNSHIKFQIFVTEK